jgi:hypothetical protein
VDARKSVEQSGLDGEPDVVDINPVVRVRYGSVTISLRYT